MSYKLKGVAGIKAKAQFKPDPEHHIDSTVYHESKLESPRNSGTRDHRPFTKLELEKQKTTGPIVKAP